MALHLLNTVGEGIHLDFEISATSSTSAETRACVRSLSSVGDTTCLPQPHLATIHLQPFSFLENSRYCYFLQLLLVLQQTPHDTYLRSTHDHEALVHVRKARHPVQPLAQGTCMPAVQGKERSDLCQSLDLFCICRNLVADPI